MNSFYSEEELKKMGFHSLGKNVFLSRKASIYGADRISLGSNCRVDDFCILSGKITIGNYVHISAYTGLFAGDAGILFEDFSGMSSRGAVYAISDDYSGEAMANAMIPDEYRNVCSGPVRVKKHCIIGTGSTVLPGVTIEEGAAVGAMSLINKNLEAWTIYAGIPCKKLKERSKELLKYEKRMK